jgi:hypothetical protein
VAERIIILEGATHRLKPTPTAPFVAWVFISVGIALAVVLIFRGWGTTRNVAIVIVVFGSLALAAFLFIFGTVFAHGGFGGTPGMRAALLGAAVCCLAASILVSIGAVEQRRRRRFLLAAAALVLAAALLAMSELAGPGFLVIPLCLLALVTPWWAPD